ncbi:MAG: nucleotidyltransferase domain-containing protein [Candidatus Omnitrophica bacterium]|nr:nucleotidyltransferase domain-containing protein [Candidatus Omnitrophota bacterium]
MGGLNLTGSTKGIIDDFLMRLKKAYQGGLVSVILYGSAASGEFAEKQSNINLLVVLEDAGLKNLNKISGLLNKNRFQIIRPLFFSEDYIKNSLDVFPVEFLDIKENYLVLYGRDVLSGLEIDIRNLRFQCEQELKAKLINLKSAYLRSRDKSFLRGLLFKSCTSILHILRNVVRLKGATPSYLKKDILEEIQRELLIDTGNFKRILDLKNTNSKLSYKEIEALFLALVEDLEKIVGLIDKL